MSEAGTEVLVGRQEGPDIRLGMVHSVAAGTLGKRMSSWIVLSWIVNCEKGKVIWGPHSGKESPNTSGVGDNQHSQRASLTLYIASRSRSQKNLMVRVCRPPKQWHFKALASFINEREENGALTQRAQGTKGGREVIAWQADHIVI